MITLSKVCNTPFSSLNTNRAQSFRISRNTMQVHFHVKECLIQEIGTALIQL